MISNAFHAAKLLARGNTPVLPPRVGAASAACVVEKRIKSI